MIAQLYVKNPVIKTFEDYTLTKHQALGQNIGLQYFNCKQFGKMLPYSLNSISPMKGILSESGAGHFLDPAYPPSEAC